MKLRSALAAVAMVAASAVAAPSQARMQADDPRALAKQVVRWNVQGQYGRVWQLLDPRFQKVTTRTFWESCKRKNAPRIELKSVKAIDSHPGRITLPLVGKLRVTAIATEMRYIAPGVSGVQQVKDTIYFEYYRGKWRGLWTAAAYDAYSHGRCPSS